MTTSFFEQWAKPYKYFNLDSAQKCAKLTSDFVEELTRKSLYNANEVYQFSTAQFEDLSQSQTFEEIRAKSLTAAFQFAPNIMKYSQQYFDICLKNAARYQMALAESEEV